MSSAAEQEIIELCERASTLFQHGDNSGMSALYSDTEDVTLFGAKGGCAKGRQAVEKITSGASASLGKGGKAQYEIVSMVVEGTLAYFTAIERIDVAAEGLASLRVTNILRRENGSWRILHRHADVFRESPFA